MYLVGMLLSNEKILNKMGNKMNEGMIAPYKKMFEKMDKEKVLPFLDSYQMSVLR